MPNRLKFCIINNSNALKFVLEKQWDVLNYSIVPDKHLTVEDGRSDWSDNACHCISTYWPCMFITMNKYA